MLRGWLLLTSAVVCMVSPCHQPWHLARPGRQQRWGATAHLGWRANHRHRPRALRPPQLQVHAFYAFSLNAFVTVFARGLDLAPGGRRKKQDVCLTQVRRHGRVQPCVMAAGHTAAAQASLQPHAARIEVPCLCAIVQFCPSIHALSPLCSSATPDVPSPPSQPPAVCAAVCVVLCAVCQAHDVPDYGL
jgi:hypothetical protein